MARPSRAPLSRLSLNQDSLFVTPSKSRLAAASPAKLSTPLTAFITAKGDEAELEADDMFPETFDEWKCRIGADAQKDSSGELEATWNNAQEVRYFPIFLHLL